MPLVSLEGRNPAIDGRQSATALQIRRGIQTGLAESQLVFTPEVSLPGGRRADLVGLDTRGLITIIEIKSSIADFSADAKWWEYKQYCDQFFFATHPDVPLHIFPGTEGLMLADGHGCEIVRKASSEKLSPATRKSLTIKLARIAALRLQHITDYHRNRI